MDVPCVYPFVVLKNTLFERSDGVTYVVTADTFAPQYNGTGTLSVPVACAVIGSTGNVTGGAPFSTSLTGLTGAVSTVSADVAGIGGGTDGETVEQYRARLLARKRQVPMGGCQYDYEAWALSYPGVTRVWVAGNGFGPGTVAIWFMMDGTYVNGIPQAADVAALQAFLATKAPVTANVLVLAPVAVLVNVTVAKLNPSTLAMRTAVTNELNTMFARMAEPGTPQANFTLYLQWVWQAVGNATGERFADVVAPSADLTFATGYIPVPGAYSIS